MGLNELLTRLENRGATNETQCNPRRVTANPAPIEARTFVTPATPRNGNVERHFPISDAGGEKTERLEFARSLYRANDAEVLQKAANDGDLPAAESRRQKVVAQLKEKPNLAYAVAVDDTGTGPVIVAVGIRGVTPAGSTVTCELRVPRAKFDPVLLLDLIARHGGTLH